MTDKWNGCIFESDHGFNQISFNVRLIHRTVENEENF